MHVIECYIVLILRNTQQNLSLVLVSLYNYKYKNIMILHHHIHSKIA